MLFWARWPHTGEIMLLLILPMPVYFYYQGKAGWPNFGRHLRASWWLIAYLLAITALSWAGSKEFEGHDYHPLRLGSALRRRGRVVFYFWGVRSGWRTPAIEAAESSSPTQRARRKVRFNRVSPRYRDAVFERKHAVMIQARGAAPNHDVAMLQRNSPLFVLSRVAAEQECRRQTE